MGGSTIINVSVDTHNFSSPVTSSVYYKTPVGGPKKILV